MRKFADFVRQQNYYRPEQTIGSIAETKYGNSCALGSYQGLLHYFTTGIHLATFPEKPKGRVSSKDNTYKLYRKFLKLRTGNYLGIEAIQLVEGKNPHSRAVYLTRESDERISRCGSMQSHAGKQSYPEDGCNRFIWHP
jgi:hypothetical protein